MVFDLAAERIRTHGQVLFDVTQFAQVFRMYSQAVFRQTHVTHVFGQLPFVLRHFLNRPRKIAHGRVIVDVGQRPRGVRQILQLLRHVTETQRKTKPTREPGARNQRQLSPLHTLH